MAMKEKFSGVPPIRFRVTDGEPFEVAIFHSDDFEALKAVREHLAAGELRGDFKVWDDQSLPPGINWKREIEAVIRRIDLAILLISPTFLSSEFCQTQEVPLLRERLDRKEIQILPILVRHCNLDDEEYDWLRELQFFPGTKETLPLDPVGRDLALADLVGVVSRMLTEIETDDEPDPTAPTSAGVSRKTPAGTQDKTILLARGRFGRGRPKDEEIVQIHFMEHGSLVSDDVTIERDKLLAEMEDEARRLATAILRECGVDKNQAPSKSLTDYSPVFTGSSSPLEALDRVAVDSPIELSGDLRLHQELRSVHHGGAGLRPWGEGIVLGRGTVDSLAYFNYKIRVINRKSVDAIYTSGVTYDDLDIMIDPDKLGDYIWSVATKKDDVSPPIYTSGSTGRPVDIKKSNVINVAHILPEIVRRATVSGEALFVDAVEDRLFKQSILGTVVAGDDVDHFKKTVIPVWMAPEVYHHPEIHL